MHVHLCATSMMFRLNAARVLTLLVLAILGSSSALGGAVIYPFNYQGKLTDSEGDPLTGNHTLYFSIHDGGDVNVAGLPGQLLYSESVVLNITGGVVNHAIGTGAPIGDPLTMNVYNAAGPLLVQVAVDIPTNVVLPRTRVHAVPYAVKSLNDASVPFSHSILGASPTPPAGYSYTGQTITTEGTWTQLADMPTTRAFACAAAVDGKLYVIGGQNGGIATNACEAYDPGTNTWETKANMTTARFGAGAAAVGDKIYVAGGTQNNSTGLSAMQVYNTVTNTWGTSASMFTPRYALGVAAVGDKVYAIAGLHMGTYSLVNHAFNTTNNTWELNADIPTQRAYPVVGVIDGFIYIVGGYNGSSYVDVHERYAPVTNSWSVRPPMQFGRTAAASSVLNNRLYAIGGSNGDPNNPLQQVEEYNGTTTFWSGKAALSDGRVGYAAATIGDSIYVAGGATSTVQFPTLLRFDPKIYYVHTKD